MSEPKPLDLDNLWAVATRGGHVTATISTSELRRLMARARDAERYEEALRQIEEAGDDCGCSSHPHNGGCGCGRRCCDIAETALAGKDPDHER